MTTISSGPASVPVTAGEALGWLAAGGSDVTGGGATVQEHGGALNPAGSSSALLESVLSDVAGRLGLFDAPGGDAGAETTGGGFGWGAAAPFVYQDAGGGDHSRTFWRSRKRLPASISRSSASGPTSSTSIAHLAKRRSQPIQQAIPSLPSSRPPVWRRARWEFCSFVDKLELSLL